MKLIRTHSGHTDFKLLVTELDQYLAKRNGECDDFFAQFNHIDALNHVVLAYAGDNPVGCGAMKPFDGTHFTDETFNDAIEIKRMFVPESQRGQGIASSVLTELELWAKELGVTRCLLETGDDMTSAIKLYEKSGFVRISNYGQYADVEDSVCFEKVL